ncbi:MAG TPA: UbiA prenyltransferase family protein [Syntrophorhabdaceae bacterium]|nr:UbiA prenyltransferase family protein [Syntrophorhabdaceae bacterium]
MNAVSVNLPRSVLSQLKLFLALSRTPHGLLDMATPAVAALLCYGAFPSLWIVCLGVVTVFAGYTTVYALNDLVDRRVDRSKSSITPAPDKQDDLDSIFVRHPVACGLLPFRKALWWALGWGFLTFIGAYLLNPLCVFVFFTSCLLEAFYCLAWRSGYLKVLISGAVKTSGAVAAIYAVDPHPSPIFLGTVFLWLFFWEMGGQNTPNDWADMREDTILQATTIPVCFGLRWAAAVIMASLVFAIVLSAAVFSLSPLPNRMAAGTLCLLAAIYLLVIPALTLCRTRQRVAAQLLFNRASYYPLACLVSVCLSMLV